MHKFIYLPFFRQFHNWSYFCIGSDKLIIYRSQWNNIKIAISHMRGWKLKFDWQLNPKICMCFLWRIYHKYRELTFILPLYLTSQFCIMSGWWYNWKLQKQSLEFWLCIFSCIISLINKLLSGVLQQCQDPSFFC